ncbi:MAG TPA: Rieske 2Fe-2S domain-containing protein [Patescibacteria group bacterium]|jgi:cytochrome b6-f complex iron-sulfur subunit|nr:Rieske 2Fe-2S domain-containing protein [Patescibacteria group bacterium]
MGNREPTVQSEEGALVAERLRALRDAPVEGISRRTLLRRSLGFGMALWLAEVTAGSISFLWSTAAGGGGRVRVGTVDQVAAMGAGLPFFEGFPVYVLAARAFVVMVDPRTRRFVPGIDEKGDGRLNVRVLSQRCPHLGCRPNPCIEDFWFHCPCHQSRYDRLGIKPAGNGYGPAERGMDRFALEVDAAGVLTVDTSHLTLGPLPIPLGQPGVIAPRVPHERACK